MSNEFEVGDVVYCDGEEFIYCGILAKGHVVLKYPYLHECFVSRVEHVSKIPPQPQAEKFEFDLSHYPPLSNKSNIQLLEDEINRLREEIAEIKANAKKF